MSVMGAEVDIFLSRVLVPLVAIVVTVLGEMGSIEEDGEEVLSMGRKGGKE